MEFDDLNKLIKSGKPALITHALQEWEKDFTAHVGPLQKALKFSDPLIIEPALKLAVKYHPQACGAQILALLTSPETIIRRLAVQSLEAVMGKPAEEALTKLLQSEADVFVLASAVTAAARLNIGLDNIRPFLSHSDIRLRANTVRAASLLGRDLLPGLLEPFLKDPALRVQNEALKGLATLASENELEQLVLQRLNSSDVLTRAATVFVTGELPLSRKIIFLVNALSDVDRRVAGCAARSLAILRDPTGIRAMIEAFLTSQDDLLAGSVIRQLSAEDASKIVAFADNLGRPPTALPILATRVLQAAEIMENWELFLPWVLGSANRKEPHIRQQALKFISGHIDFFRSNTSPLIEKAENSSDTVEVALAALIKWKSAQTEGLSILRNMLFSLKTAESGAAFNALKDEKSLIARNLLKDAEAKGLHGPQSSQQLPKGTFKLPES